MAIAFRQVVRSLLDDQVVASVDYQAELASTNTTAIQWLQACRLKSNASVAQQLPRLVIADRQSAGRGRMGRNWAALSDGLAFSLIWPGCDDRLSIAVGVAVAEAIESVAGPTQCGLKWPNDIWMAQRKTAGILVERVEVVLDHNNEKQSHAFSVIGIGINVGSSPRLEGAETTSVCEATGKLINNTELLSELIPHLVSRLTIDERMSVELTTAFQARCVLTGHDVRCHVDGKCVQGRCEGIAPTGELHVRVGDRLECCRSGEVQRVRLA